MNQKGQSFIEYALILAFIVAITGAVLSSDGLQGSMEQAADNIIARLNGTYGETASYDTAETGKVSGRQVTFTKLTVQSSSGSTNRVAWYTDDSGQRVYFPYRDQWLHDTTDLQGVSSRTDRSVQYESDGGMSTYFKATDGNYYKITDYTNGQTTLTKYNGTPEQKYVRMK